MIVLYAGASMCFSSGDITKFGDELKNVRPTMMPAVPRLLNKFYTAIREKFDALTGLKKSLVNSATETKLKNLHDNNAFTHALYDKLVFNKIKNEIFGGRLRCMIVGSAPISSEVLDFMKVALQIPILEVYGQTETGCSFLTYSSDPHSGHVGGPSAIGEFKLIDIPEMGYTSNDKGEGGIPMPRGEVLLRGAGNF
jgi:long-chain acyl-CoA synthetase